KGVMDLLHPFVAYKQYINESNTGQQGRNWIKPHAKRPGKVRASQPEPEQADDLQEKLHADADHNQGRNYVRQAKHAEQRGRQSKGEQRDVGKLPLRMNSREGTKIISIDSSSIRHARVAENQRKD